MDHICISGREFKAVTDSTLEHDMWTVQQLDRSGLRTIVMEEGEKPDAFVARMLTQLMVSGAVFDLLGGLLMPAEFQGTDWTPEMAVETGKLFGKTTGRDKDIIRRQIAGAVEVFLAQGLLSSIHSRRSSARKAETSPVPNVTGDLTSTADGAH